MSKLCRAGLSFFVCKMGVIIFTPSSFVRFRLILEQWLVPENAQCIRVNDRKSLKFCNSGPGKFSRFIWFKFMCYSVTTVSNV